MCFICFLWNTYCEYSSIHPATSYIMADGIRKLSHHRADFRFAPSQLETALLYNDASHWLGASLEPALHHFETNNMISQGCCTIEYLLEMYHKLKSHAISFPLNLFTYMPNHIEIVHKPQQYHCRDPCKYFKRLDSCGGWSVRMLICRSLR